MTMLSSIEEYNPKIQGADSKPLPSHLASCSTFKVSTPDLNVLDNYI
jgi:hypothetical protein